MAQSRKLAAIMFTDIVGYTALMGKDEQRAFELLRKNRGIQQQLITEHQGKWLKEMGDGILAQFNSATDSVQCAIDIQKRAREELGGQIRIGIHLGDVIFENEDVFGDGVNIASRLQSVADPGGIYISESLQKSIRGNSDLQTKYLGEFELKNVDYPLKTYSVQGESLPVPSTAKIKKLEGKSLKERIIGSVYTYIILLFLLPSTGWWIRNTFFNDNTQISSLVILPFYNFTGSDTLDYLMAGMHDALIGEAGKISALRVPSKKTSNAYKDVNKSIPEIASELNVDAVVEVSVSCLEDYICLQVKLVSAFPEEKQLWVKDFYVVKSQILNLHRSVAKEMAEEINVTLTPQEESLLAKSRAVDPAAYDLYMKGQFYLDQINDGSLKKATEYFKLAIEKDPSWAPPYAGLAEVGSYQKQMGFVPNLEANSMINENISKALKLDPNSSNSHYANAIIAAWTEWDWGKSEKEFLKALELNPNHARSRIFYAHLLTILRRTDEALHQGKIALQLDPLNPFTLGLYSVVLVAAGECQAALAHNEKGLSIEPDHYFTTWQLGSASECAEEYDKAFKIRRQRNYALWEEYKVTALLEKVFHDQGWLAFIEEEIRINEEVFAKDGRMGFLKQARRYMALGKYDKAMDYFEKSLEKEIRDPNLPYISKKPTYHKMKDNPRYIELLKKMNLPVD